MSVAKLKPNMKELASEPIQVQGLPGRLQGRTICIQTQRQILLHFPLGTGQDRKTWLMPWETALWDRSLSKELSWTNRPVGCWTNHHSITEYNGQWYLFYHHNDYSPPTSTRTVRYVSTHFSSTQTVLSKKVKPTLRGVGMTDARSKIQLDRYSAISPYGVSIDYLTRQTHSRDGRFYSTGQTRGRCTTMSTSALHP